MLDLTAVNDNLYEIKLLDGTELKLKRPSQAMVEFLLTIQEIKDKVKEKEMIGAFADLFERILNRNTQGKTFKAEELTQEYDFRTIGYVINDYFAYWSDEVSDAVDFQPSLSEA